MKSYDLPLNFDEDINKFEGLINEHNSGQMTAAQLKAYRVPFGIYEQREPDTYMVRVRCAAGIIKPKALKELARISANYGTKQVHLTTRQELQIHYVKLDDIIKVIKELKKVGLSTRGGGGNTVRNIIASEYAGIKSQEVFDVTPFAVALTTRLIAEEDSWTMPRKFKIAFSGSKRDLGYATICDLGFIAQIENDKKGFKVYVAGGMGAKSEVGKLFFDFVCEDQVYNIAKTTKNLFWKYGNRKNKHAARLRFLWQTLGEKDFREKFNQEYKSVKSENHQPLNIEKIEEKSIKLDIKLKSFKETPDFLLWKKRFVNEQSQKDLFSVVVPVELGFINNERVEKLADFLSSFGDNVIRLTKEQNFCIRNVHKEYLSHLYCFLKDNLNNFNRPFILDKLISCAGASTCQLGICLSRGLSRAIMKELKKSGLDLDLADSKINISGCPNACGQHHVADLGFFGKVLRKNGEMYPAYNVVIGAVIGDGKTKFASKVGDIAAKDLPYLIKKFLSIYISKYSSQKTFKEYILAEGSSDLKKICEEYKDIPDFSENKDYYFDWEAKTKFSLAGRGAGECSAGLFDLVDVDIKNIKQTKEELVLAQNKEELLLKLVFYASRMLLITRGLEPKTEEEVYNGFKKSFIDTGLVDTSFEEVIEKAKRKDYKNILSYQEKIEALAERVNFLYDNMDNAFRFNVSIEKEEASSQTKSLQMQKVFKDFRGVGCPMNFVKTKIELSKIKSKEILEVLLDDGEPIDNVPGSVKAEGHKILEQKKIANYWSVVIEKK